MKRQKTPKPAVSYLQDWANNLETNSSVAERERTKIKRILAGESVEAVTGMTREQHLARMQGID